MIFEYLENHSMKIWLRIATDVSNFSNHIYLFQVQNAEKAIRAEAAAAIDCIALEPSISKMLAKPIPVVRICLSAFTIK